jgi:succinyl-CoA synthetase beta subunit
MSILFEPDAKSLLRKNRLPVPLGREAHSVDEAIHRADELGYPLVMKAVVPSGKKKKLGGMVTVQDEAGVRAASSELLGKSIGEFIADSVYLEQFCPTDKELFISFYIDQALRLPVLLASSQGGIDIEEAAGQGSGLIRLTLDPMQGLKPHQAVQVGVDLGLTDKTLRKFAQVLLGLGRVYFSYDLKLLEINPLSITREGGLMAVGALINADDDALGRHADLRVLRESNTDRFWKPPTKLELEAIAADQSDPYRGTARYTEMPGGKIAFAGGGGGASLLLFDALKSRGLEPANYTELGGNPPEEKVYLLTKVILSKPGIQGFFMGNPITSNTQVDLMAKGVVRAFKDMGVDPESFPVVIRIAGVNNDEAERVLNEAGISFLGLGSTLPQAVDLMAKKMQAARS